MRKYSKTALMYLSHEHDYFLKKHVFMLSNIFLRQTGKQFITVMSF